MDKADKILIGGAMMFTFLKSQGKKVGDSLVEDDKLDLAKSLLSKAKEKNLKLVLPVDTVIAKEIKAGAENKTVSVDEGVPDGWKGLDIGPKTVELFKQELDGANTVVWNGPMGVFEIEDFAVGTKKIAKMLASMKVDTIIGGGDSAAAIAKFGLENDVTHVSTGGGASLAMLEGSELPGIKSITEKNSSKKNLES